MQKLLIYTISDNELSQLCKELGVEQIVARSTNRVRSREVAIANTKFFFES